MEYEIRITDENGGDPTPIILDMLKNHPLLQPYSVYVDDDKAEFIEFGTEKARDSAKKYFGTESPFKGDLRDWVKFKFGINDEEQIKRIVDKIYRKTMEEGIPPYPFLRPSTYKVVDEAEAANDSSPYLDKPHPDGCFKDMCEDIADVARETLRMNDNIYSMDLYNSIEVLRPDEIPASAEAEAKSTSRYGEHVWNDNEMGVNGKKPSNKYWRP